MALSTIGTGGRLTIPKEIRDALNLKPGDKLIAFSPGPGRIFLGKSAAWYKPKVLGAIKRKTFSP